MESQEAVTRVPKAREVRGSLGKEGQRKAWRTREAKERGLAKDFMRTLRNPRSP